MCGIVGCLNWSKSDFPISKDRFSTLVDLLEHRGPDAKGIYYDPDKNIALGHRRLSILDLTDAGKQPFWDDTERYCIVFNGEIYNYIELREQLKKKGFSFRTQTDTEVLLKLYIDQGLNFFDSLRGMFALAIWDRNEKRLLLARDHLGIKPLYYYINGDKIIFGSEPKVILKSGLYSPEPDPVGVASYLSFRYPLAPYTLFKGIQQLKPGHFMLLDSHSSYVDPKSFWTISVDEYGKNETLDEDDAVSEVKRLMLESVAYRNRSDVSLGAYLSGGLDSTIVVSALHTIRGSGINTFTIGFPEDGYNEFSYAAEAAKRYNTNHHEIETNFDEYLATLNKLIAYKDAPLGIPNEVPLYLMSCELKKKITVVLSGEGADELFGGYGRIFRSPFDLMQLSMLRHNILPADIASDLKENLSSRYGQIRNFSSIADVFNQLYPYWSDSERDKVVNPDLFDCDLISSHLQEIYADVFVGGAKHSPYHQLLAFFQKYHLPGLLGRVDITTMATSVEARVPFVDHKLVEFVVGLPVDMKMRWKSSDAFYKAFGKASHQISEVYDIPKYILRKAFENDLPQSILNRKKIGFPVPLNSWFEKSLDVLVEKYLFNADSVFNMLFPPKNINAWLDGKSFSDPLYGQKIWGLVNLSIWCEQNF